MDAGDLGLNSLLPFNGRANGLSDITLGNFAGLGVYLIMLAAL